MPRISAGHFSSLVLLIALAESGCAAFGGRAEAARPEEARAKAEAQAEAQARAEAEARAEALRKLSPAEITEAGDTAARAGEFDRAMSFYMQAIDMAPSADLWFRVGWVYQGLRKKPLAAQAFARVLELDPGHAGAHEELGLFLLENKQREEARNHLQKATELDSKRWRSYNALGVMADAAGDHEGAVAQYRAALAAQPHSAMLLNNLGYSYYLAGDLRRAAKSYEEALAAQPDYRPTLANMGLLDARQGRYENAVQVMSGVMEKSHAYNDVGYVAYQNGDLAAADKLLTEAIRLSPSYYQMAQENLRRVREAMALGAGGSPGAQAPPGRTDLALADTAPGERSSTDSRRDKPVRAMRHGRDVPAPQPIE